MVFKLKSEVSLHTIIRTSSVHKMSKQNKKVRTEEFPIIGTTKKAVYKT